MESPEAGLLRIQIFDYDEFSHHKEIGACKLRPIPTPLHWCELRREADHQVELGADIEVRRGGAEGTRGEKGRGEQREGWVGSGTEIPRMQHLKAAGHSGGHCTVAQLV